MIDEFPTLPTKQPTTNPTNFSPPDDTEFSGKSVDQSPVATTQQPIQTTFKRPLESISDSEEQTNTKTTEDQRNTVIKACRELHRHNFRDVDKLQNISIDKKENDHVVNYSDAKTIRLYCKLTENKIAIETLYKQIYNQLHKQEKLKRTKYSN